MYSHRNIVAEQVNVPPIHEQPLQFEERKGIGHPDFICDAIMEETSVALCREYLNHFGCILHHNIDKGLLVAGRTSPKPGGGKVEEPMRLIFGDRATYEYNDLRIPVGEITKDAATIWFKKNQRFVEPEKHIIF
jgi:S-adenosylmethionine synthetase